jgi:hypothetical protein
MCNSPLHFVPVQVHNLGYCKPGKGVTNCRIVETQILKVVKDEYSTKFIRTEGSQSFSVNCGYRLKES